MKLDLGGQTSGNKYTLMAFENHATNSGHMGFKHMINVYHLILRKSMLPDLEQITSALSDWNGVFNTCRVASSRIYVVTKTQL